MADTTGMGLGLKEGLPRRPCQAVCLVEHLQRGVARQSDPRGARRLMTDGAWTHGARTSLLELTAKKSGGSAPSVGPMCTSDRVTWWE